MHDIEPELEDLLRSPEPAIGDAGFSESVLRQLPAKRRSRARVRRWTLAGAAATGSLLTIVLAEPIERLLASIAVVPGPFITIVALVLIASLPLAWIFHSE